MYTQNPQTMKTLLLPLVVLIFSTTVQATTFVVNSLADNGIGTLRQAILDANANPGPDLITFNINNSTSYQTITLNQSLPIILDQVTIDGYSHLGASETTGAKRMSVSGANCAIANANYYIFQLLSNSGGSTIKGLILDGIPQGGCISMSTSDNKVYGNFLGTNHLGDKSANVASEAAVNINGSSNNVIGGVKAGERNVISGTTNGHGVRVTKNATFNYIIGNYIGTDVFGGKAVPNKNGVHIYSSSVVLIMNNIISGNEDFGISAIESNQVGALDNYIGLNSAGASAMPNEHGIYFESSSNGFAKNNYISGNNQNGIYFLGTSKSNEITGNFIGFTGKGVVDNVGNGANGIYIGDESYDNTIGGENQLPNLSGQTVIGNRISDNGANGILCAGNDNVIAGNVIGLNKLGEIAPNGSNNTGNAEHGIVLLRSASDNRIGGTPSREGKWFGNIVGENGKSGIALEGSFITKQGPDITGGPGGPLVAVPMENNLIIDNRVGIDINNMDAGNGIHGIKIQHCYSTIARFNVVGSNEGSGIFIDHLPAPYFSLVLKHYIEKNIIGVDANGDAKGNNKDGITIYGSSNSIIENTIASNKDFGLSIWPITIVNLLVVPSTENKVFGNKIGVNTSNKASGNGKDGIYLNNCGGTLIGGLTYPYAGPNTIRYNGGNGILLENFTQFTAMKYNTIANNSNSGIRIQKTSFNNSILSHSIYNNGGLGIELLSPFSTTGPDANDPLDADGGANHQQNYPELKQVLTSSSLVEFRGELESEPNQEYHIQIYYNPYAFIGAIDPSGYGEGFKVVKSFDVVTDAGGFATFLQTVPSSTFPPYNVPAGVFTATATRQTLPTFPNFPTLYYSTSEFAKNITPMSARMAVSNDEKVLNESESFASISIYPNPVQDQLTLKISESNYNGPVSVQVMDALGRQVKAFSFEKEGELLNQGFDVSSLPSGYYLLSCTLGDAVTQQKFIKQ